MFTSKSVRLDIPVRYSKNMSSNFLENFHLKTLASNLELTFGTQTMHFEEGEKVRTKFLKIPINFST